jgi:nicotinamide-nucleotide amidase
MELAQALVTILKAKGLKVTTIESCTGGLIAGAITRISGSSEVFEYGFVTYANAAKTNMVGVPEYLLESHGAVSVEVAASMAEGGLKTADADIALSVTGIAGPTGGTPTKPVGMVCFGLSRKNAYGEPETFAQIKQFGNIGRDEVRAASVQFALEWAFQTLESLGLAAGA